MLLPVASDASSPRQKAVEPARAVRANVPPATPAIPPLPRQTAPAEARLLEVYRLIGQGQARQALDKAQALVQDVPNFQLADRKSVV